MIVFRVAWACFDMLRGYGVSRAAVQHSPHGFHRRKCGSICKALRWYVFVSGQVLVLQTEIATSKWYYSKGLSAAVLSPFLHQIANQAFSHEGWVWVHSLGASDALPTAAQPMEVQMLQSVMCHASAWLGE